MKNSAALLLIFLLSLSVFAQRTPVKKPTPTKTTKTNTVDSETEEFQNASALTNLPERIAALQNFIKNFPASKQIVRAQELIVSARAQIGEQKLQAGDSTGGIESFKAAIADTPTPIPDELLTGVILQIPTNLFVRGERAAAIELARMIEEKIGANAKQIIALAAFYLGTENASEGKRLAKKAIEIDANLPSAYQTLGLASRMGFMLDESVAAYTKALELNSASIVSKRSLAEVKRAVGKPDEAIALYREILATDAEDTAARTGLILALFDAGKKQEAETELAKVSDTDPNNLFLFVGAAYWYAAKGDGAKSVEFALKAVGLEPRYVWAYIALARGYMAQKKPLEAERILLNAKQYGDFPTLDYEIASARAEAGFFREAVEILQKSFIIKDDYVRARLGGRVLLEAETFTELLGAERRASIFQPLAADSDENAARLKALLDFAQKLESAEATEAEITAAADKFIGAGDDSMRLYRQIFTARRLLQSKKALPKVLEIIQSAVPKVDAALNAPNAASAILADALYESRALAFQRRQLVLVPDVPRQTLSNILRGEIEEITGWTLFEQSKPDEAVVRLKRALSILPEKSSWWRSSQWRLGVVLVSQEKYAEALDAYIKSYADGSPDLAKYTTIETLYQKINGNTDGLEKKIGAKPTETVAQVTPTTSPTPIVEATPNPSPTPTETIAENKTETTEVSQTQETKTEETKPVQKPLFEPIIITIPKNENKPSETQKTEETKSENTEKPTDEVSSGEVRPRKIVPKTEETASCVYVNQTNISLLNGGGTIGLMVGFEKEGDLTKIKAVSSSPNDVEIVQDTEFGENSGRILFIIKSISTKTGIFTVIFEAPCGKKEVLVNVR